MDQRETTDRSYLEYVQALAAVDRGFQTLDTFFRNPITYLEGNEYTNAEYHIHGGGIVVVDFFGDNIGDANKHNDGGSNDQDAVSDDDHTVVHEFSTTHCFDKTQRERITTLLSNSEGTLRGSGNEHEDRHTEVDQGQEEDSNLPAAGNRPSPAKDKKARLRVVFVNYYRDWAFGKYLGLDKKIVEFIADRYTIHPEILRLHFGSQYGLRLAPFETDTDEVAELPLLVQSQCVMLRYGFGFLTACHAQTGLSRGELDTVIIIARNSAVDSPLLLPRINSLDLRRPDLDQMCHSTNEIFLSHLKQTSQARDIACFCQNPFAVLIPYGLIAVESDHFWMRYMQRTLNPQSQTGNLTACYYEQRSHVSKIRSNKLNIEKMVRGRMLNDQTTTRKDAHETMFETQATWPLKRSFEDDRIVYYHAAMSRRVDILTSGLHHLLTEATEQLESLRLVMSYFASFAALEESRVATHYSREGIAYTQQALKQNGRVKMLTQLAFVFVPLGAIASLFGMNLKVLNQGTADIWMFVVAVLIAYGSVLCIWGLLGPVATLRRAFGLDRPSKRAEAELPYRQSS